MYKVFFNQKPLILTSKILKSSDSNPFIHIKFSSKNQILKAVKAKKTESVYIYHKNIKKLWEIFTKKFPIIDAAGGLVERSDDKFLFIYRNNKWDLPKGGIEKKELIIEAAQREVKEETGLADLIVINKIGETYHIFKKGKNFRLKRTYWFKMKSDYQGELFPQEEEGITSVEWINKKRIPEIFKNSYENIKEIVNEVI
ncbi:MAG TPA: NUDIX domain-containing protein [Flavobacteriaceae bacterium]|jgi:8-oxo-dGTP pyrophosphatase MutT (NUDIX family)|nr:NUDIX hydrolase [Flavobacteriaceae bacterium]MDP7183664.1 NUDIX domain-containing protein [Flavobacteriaceae bacterium]HJO70908.1 NUDIX domain-containing protein [Flavobacteriaceae bacterium]|tara:strand:+ start:28771 stop:29367 length:597 start_codon:yes stop_codon:yes gene_type:complete